MNIKKPNLEFTRQPHSRDLDRVDTIVLHHSASPQDRTIYDVHRWHLERNWFGVGYHYVIHKDGTIYEGRPLDRIGAHLRGKNATTIGICVMGNFEEHHPTEEQMVATGRLVVYLINRFAERGQNLSVVRHRDLAATLCPGKNFRYIIKVDSNVIVKDEGLRNEIIKIIQSVENIRRLVE